MSTRRFCLVVGAVALSPIVSCGSGESAAPSVADAGVQSPPLDAGGDADDAAPTGCNEEWCIVPLPDTSNVSLNGVWGSAPNDVWVVGTAGYAAHFDGVQWQARRVDTLVSLFSVWGSGPNDVWASNSGATLFHHSGDGWQPAVLAPTENRPVIAMSGRGADNVYALVERAPERPEYNRECLVTSPSGNYSATASCPDVYRLSRSSGTLTWERAADDKTVCTTFRPQDRDCGRIYGLWVTPEGSPWLTGDFGFALRANTADGGIVGAADETNSVRSLFGVWGAASNDVWAVGAGGTIRHYSDGTSWTIVDSPVHTSLRAVTGTSSNDVWAVGDEGVVVHWEGNAWTISATPMPADKLRDLYAVWADDLGGVWIAGDRVLLHHTKGDAR